jgi:hypothetical protein
LIRTSTWINTPLRAGPMPGMRVAIGSQEDRYYEKSFVLRANIGFHSQLT